MKFLSTSENADVYFGSFLKGRLATKACRLILSLAVAAFSLSVAHGLEDENVKVLNAIQPTADYKFLGSNEPSCVFWPNDKVNLNFDFVKGNPSDFNIELQEITTRDPNAGISGKTSIAGRELPLYGTSGAPVNIPMTINFGSGPRTAFTMDNFPLPAKFGTYAMILKTGGKRIYLGSLARVPAARQDGTVDNVPIFGEGALDCVAHPGYYSRLGVRGWRSEGFWLETPDGKNDWSGYDKMIASAKQYGCQIMFTMEGSPDWTRPFIVPTPAAGWTPASGGMNGSGDWLCKKEYYPKYGAWIKAFAQRYWEGGKGGLFGIENYNEPWDGGGISGWASDIPTYQTLMKLISDNAKSVDPKIPILGCCSVMNTEDKLYSTGTNEFDKYIDIYTDHYVSPVASYGPEVAKLHGKESMDTETWFSDAEYDLPQVATQYLACGQNRLSPWHPAMLYDAPSYSQDSFIEPRPLCAATAAFNYFITGLKFNKMVFQDHLPFAFQFGPDDGKDSVVIMLGQLMPIGSTEMRTLIWRQINADNGGKITIDNSDGSLQFFDLAGNPEFVGQATVTIALNDMATYIKSPQGPAQIAKKLAAAKIEGKRFLEIVPHDFNTLPNSKDAILRVELRNRLNKAITGNIAVTPPTGMTLNPATQAVSLNAGETKTFEFPVASATLSPENSYPCKFDFTGADGNASYSETMNAAVVPKKTMQVNGDMSQWADVPGFSVAGSDSGIDLSELARKPWTEIQKGNPKVTSGEFKMTWDDNFVYVCAQVNDVTPEPHSNLRMEGRNEDDYFHSAADDNVSPYKEFIEDFRKKNNQPNASFGEVPYVYKKNPDEGNPFFRDRLQMAFDTTPGYHDLTPATAVPDDLHAEPDTDYEYSLYWVNDGKNNNGELFNALKPGMPRVSFYPHEPKGKLWPGAVPGAQIFVKRDGNTYIYQAAIPKSEIPDLKLTAGTEFGFTFLIGDSGGSNADYGADKAITKNNGLTMHPYYQNRANCATRWTLIQ